MRTVTNKPAVAIEALSYSRPDLPIFKNLDLQIERGQYVALLGANGSGKSTLLELILGTIKAESGTIKVSAKQIAFVPQRSAFNDAIPITVRGAIEMGRWAHRGQWRRLTKNDHQIVDQQLERMGIKEIAHKMLSELSGGQRQRTLIAQALAMEAEIIFLDEPEAGLDAEAAGLISEVLRQEVARGVSVVIATHDLASAKNAQRCIVLNRKSLGISADGTPDEVITDSVIARSFT